MKTRPTKKDSDKDFVIIALIMVSLIWWEYTLPIIAVLLVFGVFLYFKSNRFKNWVNTRILRRKPPTKPNGTKPTSVKPIPIKKEPSTPPKVIIKEVIKTEKPDIPKFTTSDLIGELTSRGKLY